MRGAPRSGFAICPAPLLIDTASTKTSGSARRSGYTLTSRFRQSKSIMFMEAPVTVVADFSFAITDCRNSLCAPMANDSHAASGESLSYIQRWQRQRLQADLNPSSTSLLSLSSSQSLTSAWLKARDLPGSIDFNINSCTRKRPSECGYSSFRPHH